MILNASLYYQNLRLKNKANIILRTSRLKLGWNK
jgi:hypothetical protein